MSKNGRAVVLLSGGMDSSTVLALAHAERLEIHALSFNYNQRHGIELEFAKMMAKAMGVKKHLVVTFDLREIGGSALTADIEVPKEGAADVRRSGGKDKDIAGGTSEFRDFRTSGLIPVTYVPARNTIFLSFALAWAEVLSAEDIFIGANAIDYSGYPDCRPEYITAFEQMANLATKASIEGGLKFTVRAPLISMSKADIIKKGTELGVDYSLTWSCYDPQAGPSGISGKNHDDRSSFNYDRVRPCGLCDSCRLRQKGFHEAGIEDPLLTKQY